MRSFWKTERKFRALLYLKKKQNDRKKAIRIWFHFKANSMQILSPSGSMQMSPPKSWPLVAGLRIYKKRKTRPALKSCLHPRKNYHPFCTLGSQMVCAASVISSWAMSWPLPCVLSLTACSSTCSPCLGTSSSSFKGNIQTEVRPESFCIAGLQEVSRFSEVLDFETKSVPLFNWFCCHIKRVQNQW